MEHLTKQTFLEKVFNFETNTEWNFQGDKPCIIDFYADWCGPCKMVGPIMEELSRDYTGKVDIYKLDTDAEQEVAAVFGIKSIPSVLFVPLGEPPQMAVGAMPKEAYQDAIEKLFNVAKPLIIQN